MPSTFEVTDKETVDKHIADNEVVVVYFGDIESEKYTAFEKVSKNFDDIVFFYVEDSELASEYEVSGTGIVMFK